MGSAGVYSFNGNKIMTTSGGGIRRVSDDGRTHRQGPLLVDPVPRALPVVRASGGRVQLPDQQHPRCARTRPVGEASGQMIARRRHLGVMYAELRACGFCSSMRRNFRPPVGDREPWLTTVKFDGAPRPDASRNA